MAINKKLIHFAKGENFDTQKENNNILDSSICFIQDRKTISTHNTEYRMMGWSMIKDPWEDIEDGVYAVSALGKPVEVASADNTCIAVALIQGPHKFWIEKNETKNTETYKAAYNKFGATNTGYTYLYWGGYGTNQTGIPTYNKADASNSYGYLPQANGSYSSTPNLSGDYTTWTSGALSDFNGKANSDVIKTITTNGTSSSKSYAPMGILLNKFNDANNEENGGYTDWYIPACGQLSLMFLNMTAINTALTAIGGQTIASDTYWSSSEYSSLYGWRVRFSNGYVSDYSKNLNYRVRFVRDF